MTLEHAVDGEKRFLEQVKEMISAAVQSGLAPQLRRFDEAVVEMKQAKRDAAEARRDADNSQKLVQTLSKSYTTIASDYRYLSNYVSRKELEDSKLERAFVEMKEAVHKYLDIVSPVLPKPTPPEHEPA